MADFFATYTDGIAAPARTMFAITPSDSTDLTNTPKAIYVGTAGTISMIGVGDTVAVSLTVQSGAIIPVRAKRVNATGTTAAGLVGLL